LTFTDLIIHENIENESMDIVIEKCAKSQIYNEMVGKIASLMLRNISKVPIRASLFLRKFYF